MKVALCTEEYDLTLNVSQIDSETPNNNSQDD